MTAEKKTSVMKLWGGRFSERTDDLVEAFTQSVSFDQILWWHDIQGSIAHAGMLRDVGVLSNEDEEAIISGLEAIAEAIKDGQFEWSQALEDVHMNIEAALTEKIGEAGKRLHTARSRNDQVATDVRLYLKDEIDLIRRQLSTLQEVIVSIAENEASTVMPGFTHLQTAQPVTFGHHMMAWYEMLNRDYERFGECRTRTDVMPLGAAALAGTSFPIDRTNTAKRLGFGAIATNSMDAVADRDFIVEFAATSAMLMSHLSRFSEELIMWTSSQFAFVELSDAFCTGSSIMPQKKNPDVAELVRGKTARVTGHLQALLMLMKGQPLTFNRDNQEDKEALFDTVHTVKTCLEVYTRMLRSLAPLRNNLRDAAGKGYSTATDLADYLVRKGIPFREAHAIVGKAVRHCVQTNQNLSTLTLEVMQELSTKIEADVYEILTPEGSVNARDHLGGTAPNQVRNAAQTARKNLKNRET